MEMKRRTIRGRLVRRKRSRLVRERFNQFMKRGFIACKIVNQGKTGVQISEFDPGAEEIFMLGLTEGG